VPRVDHSAVRRRLVAYGICLALGGVLGAVAYAGLIGIPYGPKAKGDLAAARSDRPGHRVLFVGNSLTYWNGMPSMVRRLTEETPGLGPMFVVQYTAPGWDLTRAAKHQGLRDLIEDVRWHDVVLQERSDVREPAFRPLRDRIAATGARTMIYGPGGRADYPGVLATAIALPAQVAKVGLAVEAAYQADPSLDLIADGEGHPNRAGSFLMACVFYATLTGRDPRRSAYSAELEPATSRLLKDVAWHVYTSDG
jgi:hypothetical protein